MWNPEETDFAQIPALVKSLLQIEDAKEESEEKSSMDKYVCDPCGYEYDPAVGDPDSGIPAGTAFEDLPEDWVCPICGAGKDLFKKA